MKHPKVSVLIPCYNEENYISTALSALLDQDYPDFEIIVINNASTDQTPEVVYLFIQEHAEAIDKIKYVYEGQKGTQFARECGRKLASGKIIVQMDADCIPERNWITKGVRQLNRDGVVAVTGPYYYYDGKWIVRFMTTLTQVLFLKGLNNIIQLTGRGAVLIGGNAFIWVWALEKSNWYNTELSFYGDDVDIAHRLSSVGRLLFCNRLIMKTSSRRYKAMGFIKVQKKYSHFFFRSVFNLPANGQESIELYHPR